MIAITQKEYGKIEIDNSEKDCIQIWMEEKEDNQLILVERDNVQNLIDALKQLL